MEHVLPRNINGKHADWRSSGWDDTKHALWLHRLGNLALLNDSDNSSLGNLGFQKKRSCIEDLQSTHGLSWSIQDVYRNHQSWKEDDVKSRHARLLQIFQNRWALPRHDDPAASDGPAGAVLKCQFAFIYVIHFNAHEPEAGCLLHTLLGSLILQYTLLQAMGLVTRRFPRLQPLTRFLLKRC